MANPHSYGGIDAPVKSFTEPTMASRHASIAEESVARDIEAGRGSPQDGAPLLKVPTRRGSHDPSFGYAMAGSYTRPSHIMAGTSRGAFLPGLDRSGPGYLTSNEEAAIQEEERSLLRDNNILPPKHPRQSSNTSRMGGRSIISALRRKASRTDEESVEPETSVAPHAEETTSLLPNPDLDPSLPYGGIKDDPDALTELWDESVAAGKVQTTWQREAKILAKYSRSLILTYALQYSLTICSVFFVGRLGTAELGAVSLGSMTVNITGYAVLQGLATSLDTLCAQAYGSGQHKLVGIQTQRMVIFLWVILIPIGIIWFCGSAILSRIVPDARIADLAGLYMKICFLGAPGVVVFESGKRFIQAQGLFTANLYILLFVAPFNVFLHWLLVWHLDFGFVGAPLSVAIVENLMPLLLVLYVYFFAGKECWGGLSKDALRNWWPMIKLAVPGLVMVLAECLAFEILTFGASWISNEHLAAQSVITTILVLAFQFPFPISVAASTRIANLIGATLADAAKTATKVTLVAAVIVGLINMTLVASLRWYIPRMITDDERVIEIVANTLPLCAAFQLFDALATNCGGILRGIGRQEIGGYVSLVAYYGVAVPLSFGLAFGVGMGLIGLWIGPAVALLLVASIEGWFIYIADWDRAVQEAKERIEAN